jgi:hypothetical protein
LQSTTGQVLDSLAGAGPYAADLLEESGPVLLRAAYWDWGDYSDLKR